MNRSQSALILLASLVVGVTVTPAGAASLKVKMATISPTNSPWDNIFKAMGTQWETDTAGRVTLDVYPDQVAGDEPDIIRKMKLGQYHAAALTIRGLADIDEYFSVFEIPLFFRSYDELGYVLKQLTPAFRKRLQDKGFILLGWGYVGWVHIFTTKPVATVDDLKHLKLFLWAGDGRLIQWYKRNGFRPVPLSMTDIPTGLQTGMIEAVPVPPLAAMQLQYYKLVPYMVDLGLAPMLGAMLITTRTWSRIDEADRPKLLEAGAAAEEKLLILIPNLDQTAIKLMGSQGLTVTEVSKGEHTKEWLEAAEGFANDMRGDVVPTEIYDRTVEAVTEFRQQQKAAGEAP
jgi:TRAP-type C4-dicarboxylate transport system substrate-binding protein